MVVNGYGAWFWLNDNVFTGGEHVLSVPPVRTTIFRFQLVAPE